MVLLIMFNFPNFFFFFHCPIISKILSIHIQLIVFFFHCIKMLATWGQGSSFCSYTYFKCMEYGSNYNKYLENDWMRLEKKQCIPYNHGSHSEELGFYSKFMGSHWKVLNSEVTCCDPGHHGPMTPCAGLSRPIPLCYLTGLCYRS